MAARDPLARGNVRPMRSGWQVRYRGPDGKDYARTFKLKGEAEAWRLAESKLMALEAWTPPSDREKREQAKTKKTPTVGEYCARYIEERRTAGKRPLKPTTVDNYRKLVRLTVEGTPLAARPIDQVTRADLRQWVAALPPAARTQNGKAYELLRAVFNHAMHSELIEVSPATIKGAGAPDREREPHVLTTHEVTALLDHLTPPTATGTNWRIIVLLMATCGLRINEALALRLTDLDLTEGTLTVTQTLAKIELSAGRREVIAQPPKTKQSRRTVALLPHTLPELRHWWQTIPPGPPTALLFPDERGGPMNDDQLRRRFKKACQAIGKPELRSHDMRATAATLAAQAGATTREIQALLGHTTPNMALRYQQATIERDQERARRMSQAWAK